MVAITEPQLVVINRAINDYVHLRESYKLLQMDLVASDSMCTYWQKVSETTTSLYHTEQRKFEEMSLVNDANIEALNKEKAQSRKLCIGVGVGGYLLKTNKDADD